MGQKKFLIQRSFHGEVGIRPGVQCLDLLLLGIAGRQDKNGGLLQLTQTSDNSHAVDIGKTNIQEGQDIVEAGVQADCLYITLRAINIQGGCLQTMNNFVV